MNHTILTTLDHYRRIRYDATMTNTPLIMNHAVKDIRPVQRQRIEFTRCTINGQTATDDSRGFSGIIATNDLFAKRPVHINDHVTIKFGHTCDLTSS